MVRVVLLRARSLDDLLLMVLKACTCHISHRAYGFIVVSVVLGNYQIQTQLLRLHIFVILSPVRLNTVRLLDASSVRDLR